VLVIVFNSIVDSIDFKKDPDMQLMLTDPNENSIVQFISLVLEANLWILSSKGILQQLTYQDIIYE
jgi:hypothetical protein